MSSMLVILAAATSLLGLTELPPQKADPGRCRTFLWLKQEPPLRIAMIDEANRSMRIQQGKQSLDLRENGPGIYEGNGYRIVVTLDFAAANQLTNGAIIDAGSVRIELTSPDAEAMSFPVGGMRACD